MFMRMFKTLPMVLLLSAYSAHCMMELAEPSRMVALGESGPISTGKAPKLAVFTDYESDDSVAIGLLMKFLKEHDAFEGQFLIGALLSNQYMKKALVQDMVKLFGYTATNVYAGTGGIKEPFEEEGRNILAREDSQHLHELDQSYLTATDPEVHQSPELDAKFEYMLQLADPNSIDVLLLTNPIDFVKTLVKNKEYFSKINKIYMMGGWFKDKPTYNWDLHLESVKTLLELLQETKGKPNSPQLILFSSHFFAREFNGYVNVKKFPRVIKAFDRNSHPVVTHLRNMVRNWDDNMTLIKDRYSEEDKKWRLTMVDRIGKKNIGRQFAPADPATALGYLYPDEFIVQQTPTQITLVESTDAKGKTITTVETTPLASSNVYVVDKVDLSFFSDKLVDLMSMPDPNAPKKGCCTIL